VTEGRVFVSPALWHFRKTRTQYLSERTENKHGTLVGIDGFREDTKHTTFRVYVVRCITVWPLANHIIICATKFLLTAAGLIANYASPPPPNLLQLFSFILQSLLSICSGSQQYHLQGCLSITTFFGASRWLICKRRVWLRSVPKNHVGSATFLYVMSTTHWLHVEVMGIAFHFFAPNTFRNESCRSMDRAFPLDPKI